MSLRQGRFPDSETTGNGESTQNEQIMEDYGEEFFWGTKLGVGPLSSSIRKLVGCWKDLWLEK